MPFRQRAGLRHLSLLFVCGLFTVFPTDLLADDGVVAQESDSNALAQTEAPPAEAATDPAGLRIPPGFDIELLYSVPATTQGSWVSMTADPEGRLIVCDQFGHLYRATPSPLGESGIESVERIDVALGGAQGLLCAFDSLYVMVNQSEEYSSGLYRVRDTDGDDRYDSVELLRDLGGHGGEHGPHAIVLAPNGQALYVIAGNNTDLPADINTYQLPNTWREDQLLPRNPAPTGHNTGRLAPGGWVCRVTPDGKQWDLVAAGFRNPYDLAFNREGELFTFDADMEHDVGAPWYRPTRVCHVVSGAEFGWRFGTGKWRAYYADSLPPVADVGLGSPTGVAFGYGSEFPAKYRDALYVCDWTHGRLFAVHLKPNGASYSAELEEFITGTPLPLTDILIHPIDKAMYFTIGGRKTQSGLYRVTWKGRTDDGARARDANSAKLRQLRRRLEKLHRSPSANAIDTIWEQLGHEDRFVRYAARIALEHLDSKLWQERALREFDSETAISALLALARVESTPADEVVNSAVRLWNNALSDRQKTDLLRVLEVTLARNGKPDHQASASLAAKLAEDFPARTSSFNYELCQMLVYLDSPVVVPATIELMRRSRTQEDLLSYAMPLRAATTGWSEELRAEYLALLNDAESKAISGDFVGGGHLQVYIQQIRRDAAKRMASEEKQRFAELLNPNLIDAAEVGSPTPRKFVQRWTVDDLVPHLKELDRDRSFEIGKGLFDAVGCIACHRFNNRGGIFGPDLTAVAKRYSRPVLLREIIEPSVQVSDQFQTHTILTSFGKAHSGRILERGEDHWTVAVDPRQPSAIIQIAAEDIEEAVPSTVSMMPQNLLDTLSRQEIFDLLAYLESAGDANHRAFQAQSE